MMVIQSHHQYWEIHFVVILCHLIKPLQVTTSSFVFFSDDSENEAGFKFEYYAASKNTYTSCQNVWLRQKVLSRLA